MDLEEVEGLKKLMRSPEGVVTNRFGCLMRERLYPDGSWSASSNIDNKPCRLYYLTQMPYEPVKKPVGNGITLVVHLINYGHPERPSNPEGL